MTEVIVLSLDLYLFYNHVFCSVVADSSDRTIYRQTGLNAVKFEELLDSLPTLLTEFKCMKLATDALHMYLLKMRTAQSDEDIGRLFKVSTVTVGVRLRKIRKVLVRDFVPHHLKVVRSRDFLKEHTTTMCRILFCENESPQPVLIFDGTYIYIDKSSNYNFQRDTYTDQKKRNFLKFMMCVASDGYIIHALGPYKARDNDAKILKCAFERTNAFDSLRAGDTLMLDRGFRDCVGYFKEKGFDIKMPGLIQRSERKGQLTTLEANKSRLVTATRFMVEARNGHLKSIFKIFNKTWNPKTITHLEDDVSICSALINRFFITFEPNKGIGETIARRMLARVDMVNDLANIVNSSTFQNHYKYLDIFDDFDTLPTLNEHDLIMISLGRYQIEQAASYCRVHLKNYDGLFRMFALGEEQMQKFFGHLETGESSLLLLMVRLDSRFRSKKSYDAFVLIDRNGENENVVLKYCCDCYCGSRTVGCCSHVMTLIWFALFIKNRDIPNPAGFLDNFFQGSEEVNDEDFDEDSD